MTDPEAEAARQIALADIAGDSRLAAVFDYWCARAGEGRLPRPRDIDPTELPPAVLPFITLLDVIDGGATFRIRLVGTGNVAAAGRDFTGRDIAESMPGDVLVAALERYRAAIAHRRPVLGVTEHTMRDGSTVKNLLIVLPLASDGHAVDRILGVFSPRSQWLAQQALRNLDDLSDRKPKRSHIVL